MIQYNNIFKDYLDNGIIERDDTPTDNNELVHYLPYHPVVLKDKKTTNFCVVFDASSKMKTQPSLEVVPHYGPCSCNWYKTVLLTDFN